MISANKDKSLLPDSKCCWNNILLKTLIMKSCENFFYITGLALEDTNDLLLALTAAGNLANHGWTS